MVAIVTAYRVSSQSFIPTGLTEFGSWSNLHTYRLLAHKILIGLPCKEEWKREEIKEWIKLLSDPFLKIHLLDLNLEDLNLDSIFQLDRQDTNTFTTGLLKFVERIYDILVIAWETNVDLFEKLSQTSSQVRLNPT